MKDIRYFDPVPMDLNVDLIRRRLRVPKQGRYRERFHEMLGQAIEIGRPKGAFGLAVVDGNGPDFIQIEGITFTSRIMNAYLEQGQPTYPYLLTCGRELEEWSLGLPDTLERFWADQIKKSALLGVADRVKAGIDALSEAGPTSGMSPGELADWPLVEQEGLFALLGPMAERLGVRLNKGMIMTPTKSVSGIRFHAMEAFESCQYCTQDKCPDRRVAFQAGPVRGKVPSSRRIVFFAGFRQAAPFIGSKTDSC